MNKIKFIKIILKLNFWYLIPYKINKNLQGIKYVFYRFLCFNLIITYKNEKN